MLFFRGMLDLTTINRILALNNERNTKLTYIVSVYNYYNLYIPLCRLRLALLQYNFVHLISVYENLKLKRPSLVS